jgi:hypothetical protein
MKRIFHTGAFLLILFLSQFAGSQNTQLLKPEEICWTLAEVKNNTPLGFNIYGKPGIVKTDSFEALHFNGRNNCIIVDSNPLKGLKSFTIEVIFKPDSNGKKEQRFLHFGDIDGDRVLMETRNNRKGWWLDSYIKSADKQIILIDSTMLHGYNKWYHVAMVCDNGYVKSYVNGKKELEGLIDMNQISGDRTSIGVRQNMLYWFKGSIVLIKISPVPLSTDKFISFR